MVFDLTHLLFRIEEIKTGENKTAPEKRKMYHIVRYGDDGWVLKEKGSAEVIESSMNREALIRNAIQRCLPEFSELVIHDHNGVVEDNRIFGNDSPPDE